MLMVSVFCVTAFKILNMILPLFQIYQIFYVMIASLQHLVQFLDTLKSSYLHSFESSLSWSIPRSTHLDSFTTSNIPEDFYFIPIPFSTQQDTDVVLTLLKCSLGLCCPKGSL